jgi:hypothetical protein
MVAYTEASGFPLCGADVGGLGGGSKGGLSFASRLGSRAGWAVNGARATRSCRAGAAAPSGPVLHCAGVSSIGSVLYALQRWRVDWYAGRPALQRKEI